MRQMFRLAALAAVMTTSMPATVLASTPVRVPLHLVADKQEEATPATEDDGKIWFSFLGGDYQKEALADRAILIDIVGFLFFEIGGAIWGPMLLVGAPFDMEWVLPVLVWMGACWAFTGVGTFLSWTGLGLLAWIGVFATAYIGTEVALANLDRPAVKLGAESKD